ncbi:hypothetical protein M8C21_012057 [Ambrosia artemisiifolia]|uniref:ABC transporter domain-containing protein n=1 Tax=Ambrosia artemisiifolia TaxID=4212 RepID=A0AAD5GI69_AMBAR|nr:hypothetical protein M8C21_012057 [Ambrosia artemisiifolia]
MAQLVGSEELESLRIELSEFGRSLRSSSWRASSGIGSVNNHDETEENLIQWAAIDRLSTFERLRSSLFDDENGKKVVDVTKLLPLERHIVCVQLPSVEVRYKNIRVEAECEVVHGKPLPTLWNSLQSLLSSTVTTMELSWSRMDIVMIPGLKSNRAKITILKDVTGVIKPGRMTLLLGPPGCGKTTLLTALSGNLDKSLKLEALPMNCFHSVMVDCLRTNSKLVYSHKEIMMEVNRREKEGGIIPDPDIDTFMKAISIEGQKTTLQTNYILKILGLDICADTMFGDAMRRGISGGEKKRLTTGEMIVGPTKALFMDEISNGLDSSTTYQIITCLQQLAHITDASILISLLQPSPEAFDLFDDIMLMAEGMIVYHGPRSKVLDYFEGLGFKCPERKGVADFLQEVVSRKDQATYWCWNEGAYDYVSVHTLSMRFKESSLCKEINDNISKPFMRLQNDENAISFQVYSLSKWALFKACMSREIILMKRNSFLYIFKTVQLIIIAVITMTVFWRTRLKPDIINANYYLGSLFFALVTLQVDGFLELFLTVTRLPVFYKQRDMYFYPAWAFAIPAFITKIPYSLLQSTIWTCLTYYVIGYSPEPERFFRQLLLHFWTHFTSVSLFRFLGSMFQTMVASTVAGSISILLLQTFGGFVIPHSSMPAWLKWGFWFSPISYGEIGLAVNEFLSPRWNKKFIEEILETVELYAIKDSLVGIPGVSGLSTEQRKRLTIAVEVVANPSIIFMDEPTTGLDARSAAIVMRALILLKNGGRMIYYGPLGRDSSRVIEYFELHQISLKQSVSGVPKIRDNYNPATWMLEVTSSSVEAEVGFDFGQIYSTSTLYESNKELVNTLSKPPAGSKDLYFPTRFPQNGWGQFKACLWKQHMSYWRSPAYNLLRSMHMLFSALIFGLLFWDQGRKIHNQQSLFNVLGSMYTAVITCGINNSSSAIPYVSMERTVLYRERFSGMYASWAYALAQVTIEFPYIFAQSLAFLCITYPMIGYYWSAYKVYCYFYTFLCTLMYFTYLGMLIVAVTPSIPEAAILESAFYTIFNLFSGFLIPKPVSPWNFGILYLTMITHRNRAPPIPSVRPQKAQNYAWFLRGLRQKPMGPLVQGNGATTASVDGFILA